MANIKPYSEFYVTTYTFSDDTVHRIEENADLVLAAGNICVYDNDANFGNTLRVSGIIRANAVVWFDVPFRPFDLFFQNETAGSNATIVIYGPVLKR